MYNVYFHQNSHHMWTEQNIWSHYSAFGEVFHVHRRFFPTRAHLLAICPPSCQVHLAGREREHAGDRFGYKSDQRIMSLLSRSSSSPNSSAKAKHRKHKQQSRSGRIILGTNLIPVGNDVTIQVVLVVEQVNKYSHIISFPVSKVRTIESSQVRLGIQST